jgi:hypothetical protein
LRSKIWKTALSRVFRSGLEDKKGGVIGDRGTIALIVFGRIYAKLDEIRRTRAHLARGGARTRDALAEAAGVPAFLADRAFAEADRFARMDLERAWEHLLEAELAVKGEPPGPEAALERLAVRLCGPIAGEALASVGARR